MTLRTLNYGNYGIFLIMGNAGFCPSTVRPPGMEPNTTKPGRPKFSKPKEPFRGTLIATVNGGLKAETLQNCGSRSHALINSVLRLRVLFGIPGPRVFRFRVRKGPWKLGR